MCSPIRHCSVNTSYEQNWCPYICDVCMFAQKLLKLKNDSADFGQVFTAQLLFRRRNSAQKSVKILISIGLVVFEFMENLLQVHTYKLTILLIVLTDLFRVITLANIARPSDFLQIICCLNELCVTFKCHYENFSETTLYKITRDFFIG